MPALRVLQRQARKRLQTARRACTTFLSRATSWLGALDRRHSRPPAGGTLAQPLNLSRRESHNYVSRPSCTPRRRDARARADAGQDARRDERSVFVARGAQWCARHGVGQRAERQDSCGSAERPELFGALRRRVEDRASQGPDSRSFVHRGPSLQLLARYRSRPRDLAPHDARGLCRRDAKLDDRLGFGRAGTFRECELGLERRRLRLARRESLHGHPIRRRRRRHYRA